jgi:hypothetical protein
MERRMKAFIGGIAVASAVGTGTTMALAGGADDDATDTPIPSPDLEKASAAALDHTGAPRAQEDRGPAVLEARPRRRALHQCADRPARR